MYTRFLSQFDSSGHGGEYRIQLIIDFEISINAIQRKADRLTSTLLQPGLA